MKRDPRYQTTALSTRFVRSNDNRYLTARKIFVINQELDVTRGNESGQRIQRILIFDNHPDSLRLVFGRANLPLHSSEQSCVTSSGIAVLWVLAFALMFGVIWAIL